MMGLSGRVRVFVYAGTCDMRRQISGLMTMVREELGRDPQCGDLYVFRGRRGDQIKILFYDRRGLIAAPSTMLAVSAPRDDPRATHRWCEP
jgi:transposase